MCRVPRRCPRAVWRARHEPGRDLGQLKWPGLRGGGRRDQDPWWAAAGDPVRAFHSATLQHLRPHAIRGLSRGAPSARKRGVDGQQGGLPPGRFSSEGRRLNVRWHFYLRGFHPVRVLSARNAISVSCARLSAQRGPCAEKAALQPEGCFSRVFPAAS